MTKRKTTPPTQYERVKRSNEARQAGGEQPVQIGPVWIESKHATSKDALKRIRAEGQAAFRKAMTKYVKK